jgi:hypothetical protein
MTDYYLHWIITQNGKFYLGYDFHLGYEALYDEGKKNLASAFESDTPFDKTNWLPENRILDQGVEPYKSPVMEVFEKALESGGPNEEMLAMRNWYVEIKQQQSALQYTIITARTSDELSRSVSEKLNDGWILQGGVSIAYPSTHIGGIHGDMTKETYAQAMTKISDV